MCQQQYESATNIREAFLAEPQVKKAHVQMCRSCEPLLTAVPLPSATGVGRCHGSVAGSVPSVPSSGLDYPG